MLEGDSSLDNTFLLSPAFPEGSAESVYLVCTEKLLRLKRSVATSDGETDAGVWTLCW